MIVKWIIVASSLMPLFISFVRGQQESPYYYDYYCDNPLIEWTNAKLTATSKLPGRGPEQARFYTSPGSWSTMKRPQSDVAWVPSVVDLNQNLYISFPRRMEIRRLALMGFNGAWVTEFHLAISNDGDNWRSVFPASSELSTILFKGNVDGDTINANVFETPIIAQFVRINPTRWRERISLRVELYGCDYVSETLSFNGTAMVYKNLTLWGAAIKSRRDVIKFRLRTNQPDGLVMYSRGTQGDYLALQLVDSRLVLNINLGSGTMTSMTGGSLLDDSLWHDVTISRVLNHLTFTVDRVEQKQTIQGDFAQLDLDTAFYIGGVPHLDEGIIIGKNFTGCLENVYLNHTNVIRTLKEPPYEEYERFYKNFTVYNCPDSQIVPITFLPRQTKIAWIQQQGYEGINSFNVSFEFRTYEDRGLILYHKFTSFGYIKLFIEKSKLLIEIETQTSPKLQLDNFATLFNDGLWHKTELTVSNNLITLTVDDRQVRTVRLLQVITGGIYFFGGTPATVTVPTFYGTESTPGFIGCLRQISIDSAFRSPLDWKVDQDYCCKDNLVLDSCQMLDRCSPNPCEHEGICTQSSEEFLCNCGETGYTGAVCHLPLNPLSCQSYRETHSGVNQRAEVTIDPDGSGPLAPFPVTCQYFMDGLTQTHIHHRNEEATLVDGYSEPGSFVQNIEYDGDLYQIEAVINRSSVCRQFIKYECRNSKLFNSPSRDIEEFSPNTYWVSRRNQPMDYWGDSLPGSRKCDCGILGQCASPDRWCNCDSGFDHWLSDEGHLTDLATLPVKQLRIGDTGTVTDDKMGRYTLGPLICEGDALFDSVITFRKADAFLQFPLPELSHSWDIYFEFKTTTQNAVILHAKGPQDYVKVSIIGGDQIQFQVEAGSGPMGVNVETSNKLSDNRWHSVHIEKNRKQARIIIDGSHSSVVLQPAGQVRAIELTSDLYIGSTVDERDGYVGCIRAVLINGQMLDIVRAAESNRYGLSLGCEGRCDSNPCLNNGTCFEGYDGYTCDCRFTAFKGPICADEIGINLQANSMVRYEFWGSYKSTIAEKIRVGFTTTQPQGFLLGIFSNITGEYLTLMVSNSGHLRLVFDFGFERQELIFPEQNFMTGQYHDVQISRMDSGTKLMMKVDNLEPKIFPFDVKQSADAQFNNIQYLYIGKNESMREGFIGCISRVEFDDIYPLKYYFQENRPKNIQSLPGDLVEDFCGVEPVTHPKEVDEKKPAPKIDEGKLRRISRNTQSAVLGGVLAVIFIAIVIMAVLIGRYLSAHKGEYLTQEDEGADGATDPNEAIIHSTTGHHVAQKKEWFI